MRIRRRVKESENLQEYKKGLWSIEEDKILMDYVLTHGSGQWNRVFRKTGLKRCGKSCRLRWMNYLSPNVNKGSFTEQEQDLIARLYKLLGNRWSLIAKRIPGRTDNQIKNYCNTYLRKKHVGGYSYAIKNTGDGKDSPPSLFITTATTSSRDHQQDNNLCNNITKNFKDVVLAQYNDKPKADSTQNNVVNANTDDPDLAFSINEDVFDLSSFVMMDSDFY